MVGENQGQSHQISNVTIGPDQKLYVHMGDGFDSNTAQNLDSYRGKILRMNLDGTAPTDNPFYNAVGGINARDYVYAYGVRNPFGGAWRAADGKHYEVENGPSIDRFAQINRGVNYGWDGSDFSMTNLAIYNWNPAHAPVNITFVEPQTFGGSDFPASLQDMAFVSESGPTYATGPQARGKRIVYFQLNASGGLVSGPTTFVEYVGTGKGSVVGLATGPDGLYFTEMYKDLDAVTPIDAGARVFRVRFAASGQGDFNEDDNVDAADWVLWRKMQGTTGMPAYSGADGDGDGDVDASDVNVWRANFGDTLGIGGGSGSSAGAASGTAAAAGPSPTVAQVSGQGAADQPAARDQALAALDAAGSSVEERAGTHRGRGPSARIREAWSELDVDSLLVLARSSSRDGHQSDAESPARNGRCADAVGDDLELDRVFSELASAGLRRFGGSRCGSGT
jgi:hypothetical protein